MKILSILAVVFLGVLSTQTAAAQIASTQRDASIQPSAAAPPVAYVYVSNVPDRNVALFDIYGFAAAADGSLKPIHGSPFNDAQGNDSVQTLAVNGKYLFGANIFSIHTLAIQFDGSLKPVATTNNPQGTSKELSSLVLDQTGATLYATSSSSIKDVSYESFTIDKATGKLKYLGAIGGAQNTLTFIGNNVYAYGVVCATGKNTSRTSGFKRQSNGALSYVSSVPPPTPPAGKVYCPVAVAADPVNHAAVALIEVDPATFQNEGVQVAVYTADSRGHLTTKSTQSNMPQSMLSDARDMKMSPSGKLLAVSGTAGIQIFGFHGSDPVTLYTGLLGNGEIDQMFWDNANHLYAISAHLGGQLFVFTATPQGVKQAPGSPHSLQFPQNLIVQPLTKP